MCLPCRWRFTALILPLANAVQAAPPRLVKDINTRPDVTELGVEWMLPAKGGAVFTAPSLPYGDELWVAGPTGQVSLLKDIWPGADDSWPQQAISDGSTIYFQATTRKHGTELWQSDGTPKGTRLLADVWRGPESSGAVPLHAVDGRVFFYAETQPHTSGYVWVAGPSGNAVNLNPSGNTGQRFEYAQSFSSQGGTTWFVANHREIWKSDGSFNGTVMVESVAAQTFPDSFSMKAGEGILFLIGYDSSIGSTVLGSRGPAGPTTRISPLTPGWQFNQPTATILKNRLIFTVTVPDGASTRTALWASDGTAAGTREIPLQHNGESYYFPRDLTAWNGAVYFDALTDVPESSIPGLPEYKHALWKTDGTEAGTVVVKEFAPEIYRTEYFGAAEFQTGTSQLYFKTGLDQLWQSDGTMAGTFAVTQAQESLSLFDHAAAAGDQLVFVTEGFSGDSMWRTRGAGLPAEEITATEKNLSGVVSELHPGEPGSVLFGGDSGTQVLELWRSDGTAKNTKPAWNTALNLPRASLMPMITVGSKVIWASDGDFGGPDEPAAVVATDLDGGNPQTLVELQGYDGANYFTLAGNRCLFVVYASQSTQLWQTDGSAAGTVKLAESVTGSDFSSIETLVGFGGEAYFFNHVPFKDTHSLWRSDAGNPAGVVKVKELGPEFKGSPGRLEVAGNRLFFMQSRGSEHDLWTSDGSEAGTTLFTTLQGDLSFSRIVGNQLLFTLRSYVDDTTFWYRSDGTAAGTLPFHDLTHTQLESTLPHAVAGNTLFYVAGAHTTTPWIGQELWKTDGTAAGTKLVRDIFPGDGEPLIENLTAIGDEVYFAATDGRHGIEVWRSNGTTKGTRMVGDIERGAGDSMPGGFTVSGNKLFFHATRPKLGTELHVLDLPKKRGR